MFETDYQVTTELREQMGDIKAIQGSAATGSQQHPQGSESSVPGGGHRSGPVCRELAPRDGEETQATWRDQGQVFQPAASGEVLADRIDSQIRA